MATYTDAQKKIIDSDSSNVSVLLYFVGNDGFWEQIDNSSIYSESLSLEESLYEGDEITFGKCNASCFKIKIANNDNDYVGGNLQVYLIFKNRDGNVTVQLGNYTVFSAERTADRMFKEIVAYDYMTKFDVDVTKWYNETLYPPQTDAEGKTYYNKRTVKEILQMLCRKVGVTLSDNIPMVNGFLEVGKTIEPTSLSGRDLLQSICEINGAFGHFNENGRLELIRLNREDLLYPAETLYPSDSLFPKSGFFDAPDDITIYKSCDYKDYETSKFDSVSIRMEDDDIGVTYSAKGKTNNMYTVMANPLTFGLEQDILNNVAKNLYDVVSGLYFQPCNTVVSKGLYIELGNPYDIFVVQPTEREVYTAQLTSYVMRRELNGIQAISSTFISEGTKDVKPYVSPLNSEYKQLQGKYHNLVMDLDTFKSEVGVIDGDKTLVSRIQQNADSISLEVQRASEAEGSLSSLIEQTADSITSRVNNLQNQVNGQVTKYSGSVVPTLSNYPASSWNDEQKSANVGSVYTVNDKGGTYAGTSYRFMYDETDGYYWQEMSDTEIAELKAQIVELGSEINQTATNITSTVAKNIKSYNEIDEDGNPYDIKVYGFGVLIKRVGQRPYSYIYNDTIQQGEKYLNMEDGKLYLVTSIENDSTGKRVANLGLLKTLPLISTELSSRIDQTADSIDLIVEEQEDMSSRISQTAKSIELSVNNGSTSSGITIRVVNEDGTVSEDTENITMTGLVAFNDLNNTSKTTINGGTIKTGTISADRLDVNGIFAKNVTATGTITGVNLVGANISATDTFKLLKHVNALTTRYDNFIESRYENIGTYPLTTFDSVAHIGRGWNVVFDNAVLFNGGAFGSTQANGRASAVFSRGIRCDNSGSMIIGSTTYDYVGLYCSGRGYFAGALCPEADSTRDLGMSNLRWNNVRAKNGTIQTSDKNEKHDIEAISNKYEDMFLDLKPVSYVFNNGERVHTGFIAQEVEEAMSNNDISDMEFAALCKDDVDGNDVYGLRYQEFIALNTHMIQKAYQKIEEQQKEIETLKEQVSFLMSKLGGKE